jgi:hypothetical protein
MSGGRHTGDSYDGGRLPRLVTELVTAAEALSALSASLRLHCSGEHAALAVEHGLSEVRAALGLEELLEFERGDLATLSDVMRARVIWASELCLEPLRAPGWTPSDVEISAASLSAETIVPLLSSAVVPRLAGLAERLARPGAAFLEVGVGGGGLIVALCRMWPYLIGTGIDIHARSLELARKRLADAGLGQRVNLRLEDVAELEDRAAYDLAWLPASFIGADVLPDAARRVRLATRPGGWVILSMHGGADELSVALARLRTARDGGTLLSPSLAKTMLVDAGWESVHQLPRQPMSAVWMTAGRRPPVE